MKQAKIMAFLMAFILFKATDIQAMAGRVEVCNHSGTKNYTISLSSEKSVALGKCVDTGLTDIKIYQYCKGKARHLKGKHSNIITVPKVKHPIKTLKKLIGGKFNIYGHHYTSTWRGVTTQNKLAPHCNHGEKL